MEKSKDCTFDGKTLNDGQSMCVADKCAICRNGDIDYYVEASGGLE